MALSIEDRIRIIWPDAGVGDVISITPLGSRQDSLLYNRRTCEVSTGMVGTDHACFKASIEDFEMKLEKAYMPLATAANYPRWRDEYRAAMRFLRSLPPLP